MQFNTKYQTVTCGLIVILCSVRVTYTEKQRIQFRVSLDCR